MTIEYLSPSNIDFKMPNKAIKKILAQQQVLDAEIFASPFETWLTYTAFLLCGGIGLLPLFYNYGSLYFILLYALCSLLINGKLNNSFALNNQELIVINPYIPFRQVERFELNTIKQITITKAKLPWWRAFIIMGDHYIEIETHTRRQRFYCVNLETDAFDENFSEKTIQDLNHSLLKRHLKVNYLLD